LKGTEEEEEKDGDEHGGNEMNGREGSYDVL
jgi:hypothetical protein